MKKSEFAKTRNDHHRAQGMTTPSVIVELVRRDIEAAEAAGIAWAPEAPALPERLGWGWSSARRCYYLYPAGAPPDTEPFESYYAEAVRRYNTWPALRAWANGSDGPLHAGGLGRFLAILDGPAE